MKLFKNRGFTLIELMIVVAIIGILAAIAIPNFIKFQARSKQAEARTNLKSVFTAQKSYFGEQDKYGISFKHVGFAPEPGNRYSYGLVVPCNKAAAATDTNCLGTDIKFPVPAAQDPFAAEGVLPTPADCPGACFFNAGAVGNIDNDPKSDSWGITSSTPDGVLLADPCGVDATKALPGEPTNAYNDVSCP